MTSTELENLSLDELIVALRQIGVSEDRMERAKEVEAVKSAFYKLLGKLKAEAEAAGENVEEKFSAQEEAFKMVYSDYKKERSVYNREQDASNTTSLPDEPRWQELADMLNDDAVQAQASVRYAFPLKGRFAWFIQPLADFTYYTNTTRHTWQVALRTGLAF